MNRDSHGGFSWCANSNIGIRSRSLQVNQILIQPVYIVHNFFVLLARVLQIIMERFMKPWLTIDLVFYFTRKGQEHQRLLMKLHAFTQSVRHTLIRPDFYSLNILLIQDSGLDLGN